MKKKILLSMVPIGIIGSLIAFPSVRMLFVKYFILLNAFNPMVWGFITHFHFTNKTADTLLITPLGIDSHHVPGPKEYFVLNQYTRKIPAFPSKQSKDILVQPGAHVRIFYDDDNLCLANIAIRLPESKSFFDLLVNDSETGCHEIKPKVASFTVETIESLTPASEKTKTLIKKLGIISTD